MCGICGILDFEEPPERETICRMVSALRHRGPDAEGVFLQKQVGLGHARLSIIDLSASASQPMTSSDGQMCLVYNGEVYNFLELRQELATQGVAFRSRSDTEVVLEAYRKWGPASFPRFNGMFAFALWDPNGPALHLVRDPFGIKPIYYAPTAHGLIFASEIKAILATGRVTPRLSLTGLHQYLYHGYTIAPQTLFEGIAKLPPGCALCGRRGDRSVRAYWSVEQIQPVHDDLATAAEKVRTLLGASVRRHLISDVPVGIFLSGGVDSSAITAMATQQHSGQLRTYSVGFDFAQGVQELPKARRVAQQFGTDHHELYISGQKMPPLMERLVECHDEPFGDAADIPLYLLCRELGGAVKVVLQGDGGDEVFAGYHFHYGLVSHPRLSRWAAEILSPWSDWLMQGEMRRRIQRFIHIASAADPAMRLARLLIRGSSDNRPTRLLTKEWQQRLASEDPFTGYRECYPLLMRWDSIQQTLLMDFSINLPNCFFEKVDKPTMAYGIEARVPFMDLELASYVLGLPGRLKYHRGENKRVLKRALRGLVPDDILDGPKTGFGVPIRHWLRTSLLDYWKSVLFDPLVVRWGMFDRSRLEQALDSHVKGSIDHGHELYRLLQLALWYRQYLHLGSASI